MAIDTEDRFKTVEVELPRQLSAKEKVLKLIEESSWDDIQVIVVTKETLEEYEGESIEYEVWEELKCRNEWENFVEYAMSHQCVNDQIVDVWYEIRSIRDEFEEDEEDEDD